MNAQNLLNRVLADVQSGDYARGIGDDTSGAIERWLGQNPERPLHTVAELLDLAHQFGLRVGTQADAARVLRFVKALGVELKP